VASRYRKIDPRIWNDEKFRTMSEDGKLVFLFLLTHPHMTSLGAMRGTLPGLAAELGWSTRRFISAAQECMSRHIVELNEKAAWIGIPNFLRYNEPEGPNSVSKAWALALDMLPECLEKHGLIERCRSYLAAQSDAFKHAMGHAIWDAFGDAKSGPCHIQEQEQEREQEQESPLPPQGTTAGVRELLAPEDIQERWNSIAGVKPCKEIGKTIRVRVQARLKEHSKPEWWDNLFQRVQASDFLCGRTNGTRGPFRVPLTWILAPKNLDKLLAGDYDPVTSNGHGPALTCTKRVQGPGDMFLRHCGQPASPQSRPAEPRCAEHLSGANQPQEEAHADN
jgi:hypothetical protein